MRTLLVLCMGFLAVVPRTALSRQVPSALRLRIAALDTVCYPNCAHPTEWKASLVAEFLDSAGTVLPPDAQAFYQYGADYCGGNGFGWGFAGGTGLWYLDVDGNKIKNTAGCCASCPYQSYIVGVRVMVGSAYLTSELIRVPDGGTEWMSVHAEAAPNPFDLTNSPTLTLSLPVQDDVVQVSFLSISGELVFGREYSTSEYVVHVPAKDFAENISSGVFFVVAKTSSEQFIMKVVFLKR
jgi:hypothetical protein